MKGTVTVGRKPATGMRRLSPAFSLMEVMVALAIFFIAVFAILGLISQLLRNARAFQNKKGADANMVHAYWSSITNRVTEGMESGEFSDLADFKDQYRDYSWEKDTMYYATNGLWQVDYRVINKRSGQVESSVSTFFYDPNTRSSSFGGVAP
jgi:Tfp pilus assembly protein PilV